MKLRKLAAVLLAILTVFAFSACNIVEKRSPDATPAPAPVLEDDSNEIDLIGKDSSGTGLYTYEYSDYYTPGDVVLNGYPESIDIEWLSGSVIVLTGGDTMTISEEIPEGLPTDQHVFWYVDESSNSVHIRPMASDRYSECMEKILTVTVPNTVNLDTLVIATDDADINVRDVAVSDVGLMTNSGEVTFSSMVGNEIILQSSTGNITASWSKAADTVEASSTSGNITLDAECFEAVSAMSVNGSVDVTVEKAGEEAYLSSGAGDVMLHAKGVSGYTLTIDTESGTATADGEIDGNTCTYGDGKWSVNIIALTGNILVEAE